jgi:hypothetical protein
LKHKARAWTEKALDDIRVAFPVPIKGLDSDNGAECINRHLFHWGEQHSIAFARGGQYHKNDNAYVGQKNGGIVRKTIGYGRFQGGDALNAPAQVCSIRNPLNHFFYPNLKRIGKKQAGQKAKRVYEKAPKTPFQRIMEREDIPNKQPLVKQKESLNIVVLQEALDRALDTLQRFIQHTPGGVVRHDPALPDSAHGKNLA